MSQSSSSKKLTRTLDVTQGPITTQLLMLMWPILLSYVFQELYQATNSMIVGRFSGKEALGALQITVPIIDLATVFTVGITTGCAILVGQYFGERNTTKLSDSIHTAFALTFIGGLILSVATICVLEPTLLWLDTPEELMFEAFGYSLAYFSGFAFFIVLNMGCAIFRALGNTKTPSYIYGVAYVINILFDFVFVGYFELGAIGCGIATSLSFVCATGIVLYLLTQTTEPWKVHLQKIKLDTKIALSMLKTGIPLGIQASVYSISGIVEQGAVNGFGTDAIASWGLSTRIENITWIVADALSAAFIAFCAQNYGAQNYQRMKKGLKISILLSIFGIGSLSALIYSQAPIIAQLFIDDLTISELCAYIARITIPFIMFISISDCIAGLIRSTGESFIPMIISIIGTCIVRIGWLEIIVPHYYTLETILISYPFTWILTVIMFVLYYFFGGWRKQTHFCTITKKSALES